MPAKKTIFLVDDDAAICHALSVFLEASGYGVRTFPSAEAFLGAILDMPDGIMLLDQRMTSMTGLELQSELVRRGIDLPIIFITGHGDVQMSVKAIKAGAIDFLEKPLSNKDMLTSIREAFSRADSTKKHRIQVAEFRKRHASLTAREQEVLRYVVAGMSNKDLAELLDLSDRTVETHRSRLMKKMGSKTLPDMVQKYILCEKSSLL